MAGVQVIIVPIMCVVVLIHVLWQVSRQALRCLFVQCFMSGKANVLGRMNTSKRLWRTTVRLSSARFASSFDRSQVVWHLFWHSVLWQWSKTSVTNSPSPPLDNIRVMLLDWRLSGNISRTAVCWIVWHNVYSPQHTYVSSSYRSNRLGLSHWDPYSVHRGDCL